MPRMLSGHLQGRFLSLISKIVQPEVVLEIGTFTGYAALCLAEGLKPNGKLITLEVLVTRAGAFVQVSDQGEGFDVAATCERFRAGSPYFTHGGSGFRKFEKARGIVSFDDGGRTFRACFHAPSGR